MLVFSVASLVIISGKWVSNLIPSKFLSMRKISFQYDCLCFSDIYQKNYKKKLDAFLQLPANTPNFRLF